MAQIICVCHSTSAGSPQYLQTPSKSTPKNSQVSARFGSVQPGDVFQLAVLEADPRLGLLRFTITDHEPLGPLAGTSQQPKGDEGSSSAASEQGSNGEDDGQGQDGWEEEGEDSAAMRDIEAAWAWSPGSMEAKAAQGGQE